MGERVKLEVAQVAHRLFAEQVAQLEMAHVTQVPVELMVRLLAHAEQKLLALQVVHWATLQATHTDPLLIGFPVVQVVQVLLAVQREHP